MELTQEQREDIAARQQAFIKDFNELYGALKAKHECELVYGVVTVPSPSGVFGLTVSETVEDKKYAAKPSPFVPTEDGGVKEA